MITSPLRFFRLLKAALTPIPDQWTLTSLDGEVYEEVDIEHLTSRSVTFKHRVGRVRMPLALLNEASQQRIHRGFAEVEPESQLAGEEIRCIVHLDRNAPRFQGA